MSYLDERSDISASVQWLNPYTNKNEDHSIYLPNEIVYQVIPEWLKTKGIVATSTQFKNLLDSLDIDIDNLEYDPDFCELAVKEYYKTRYWEEDKAQLLDEYEMLNNLGEYEEEDIYVS